jgi:GTP cyclohydrolase II
MLRDPCGPAGSASAAPPPPADASASEALKPRVVEQLLRLQSDLRLGLPVILLDGAAATLIALVETLTEARYRAITALGAAELALTRRRAEALGIELPKPSDTWCFPVPEAADSAWLAAVAGRDAQASGAAAPDRLPALHAGSSVHGAAIALARTAQALPAVLAVPLTAATAPSGLLAMPVDTALQALERARAHEPVSSARLPTDASEAGRVHAFRPVGGGRRTLRHRDRCAGLHVSPSWCGCTRPASPVTCSAASSATAVRSCAPPWP